MHGFMGRLLAKTVELSRATNGFSHERLRALIDSSPLVGAGRVEDTFNLLGRAIVQLVEVAAEEAGEQADAVAAELRLSIVSATSIKAAWMWTGGHPSPGRKRSMSCSLSTEGSRHGFKSSEHEVAAPLLAGVEAQGYEVVELQKCREVIETRLWSFSVQRDHIHLIVEADSEAVLSRGMQGFAIRVAKGINRFLGRTGRVFDDRYHAQPVTSPRQARNALC